VDGDRRLGQLGDGLEPFEELVGDAADVLALGAVVALEETPVVQAQKVRSTCVAVIATARNTARPMYTAPAVSRCEGVTL